MKINKTIMILTLFIVLLCAIGGVSASEDVDNVDDIGLSDELALADDDTIDEAVAESDDSKSVEKDEQALGVSEEPALSDEETPSSSEKIIYVGHHNTTLYGNGSYDNPFSNFKSACDSVNGENNVTINVFSGRYLLGENLDVGEHLKFNTSNLNIIGINGMVEITYCNNHQWQVIEDLPYIKAEAFELTSASANITFSNVIFNATGCIVTPDFGDGDGKANYFLPFTGQTNLAVFNNCSFIGFEVPKITGAGYNSKFVKCYFNILASFLFYESGFAKNTYHIFEYCIFDKDVRYLKKINLPCEITIDNCWFGQNNLPGFITPPKGMVMQNGKQVSGYVIPVSRYAVLSVSYTYLGDNKFEIVGQFTWNGTNDTDGMENFQPMDVIFETTTGSVNKTVTLVNGSFRTIYTSNSNENELFVTLINEEFKFNFTTTDVVIDAPSIHYGDDQNITVNFSQSINSTVNITINNNTYSIKVNESDSFTYTIEDILTEGNYTVDVVLIDEENHVYGSNSTILTVSKISDYTFNPEINDNGDIKVGDEVTITVELPEDVSGNVTVKVNDNPVITKEATQNTVIVINNLVGGNNNIIIAYNGNDKYIAKTSAPQVVTAQKASVPGGENILNMTTPANSATPTFTINLPNATGNLTVIVDGKDKHTKALENGSATITLPELSAGKHDITVTYSGDNKYESISKNTTVNVPAKTTPSKTPTVKKAATKITAKKKTFKAKTKVKKYTITLKSGKKPVKKVQVTIKIGKKTYKAKTNAKGKATFKIKKLSKKGKYNAVIKFKGNKNYKASSKKVKITLK